MPERQQLPAGRLTLRYAFAYDGGPQPGAGGTGTLYVDEAEAGQGRIEQTVPYSFSLY